MYGFTIKTEGALSAIVTEVEVSDYFNYELFTQKPARLRVNALWDTGSTHCSISIRLVERLNLVPNSYVNVQHAGGISGCNKYTIYLTIKSVGKARIVKFTLEMDVFEFVAPDDFDIILGMNVINLGDFCITNFQGNTTVSFTIPSRGEIDFGH